MALKIQTSGKELLLNPGSKLEIEEASPILQTDDTIQGDFSYPLTVPIKGNEKALNFPHFLQTRGKSSSITNVIVNDDLEYLTGLLRLEKININLNGTTADNASLYFLKGFSSFYKDVENKTLQNLEYGGNRTFGFAPVGNEYDTPIYKHYDDVLKHGSIDKYDYAMFPIYHTNFSGDTGGNDSIKIYNLCVSTGDPLQPRLAAAGNTALFPYINYLIKRIFDSFGWTVEGFNFTDPDFKKAVLLTVQNVTPVLSEFGNEVPGQYSINLKRVVPPVGITSFLIGLKNRFGWWYDFDNVRRHCTIKPVAELFTGDKRIDITSLINTSLTITVNPTPKVYAMAGDTDAPDKSLWDQQPVLAVYSALPAPGVAYSGQVHFVAAHDKYYICLADENHVYHWEVLEENDFGVTPADKTDTISSNCLVPVMRVEDFFDSGFSAQGKMLIPEVSLDDENTTGDIFYACFAHGMAPDEPHQNPTVLYYPYGAAHPYDLLGNKLTAFSMSYEWPEPGTGKDLGVYAVFWQKFLSKLSFEETLQVVARLTPQLLLSFTWETTYLINHTEYIIQKRNRNMPYDGSVVLTLVRI
jgi:hypothetical protein